MTITESLPYGIIKSQLKKTDKIGIVSCSACVSFCETGGKEKMDELAERLIKDGFNVVDKDLIGIACDLEQVKKIEFEGDVIIVLSCDAGVYNIKKMVGYKKVIPALNTVGIGVRDAQGNINLVRKFG
ncbi:hypothetical protein JW911_01985 [Candidatus Peregrinibacteria bacterium]|nr:hypothetical protein [Candidatus Peregrinibacteria bacterium]